MILNNSLDVSEITMSNNDVEEFTEFINAATDTDFIVEDIDFTTSPTAGVFSKSLETKKGLYIYIYIFTFRLFIYLKILKYFYFYFSLQL